jgi:DNA-3-methyladenine glycosylase
MQSGRSRQHKRQSGDSNSHKLHLKKLPRRFYTRPTLVVARELLGKYFIRRFGQTHLIGQIVEVEAYLGSTDPASHTYRGKTERNAVMFNEGGHLYVYFTYGMHYCCNVVTESEGIGNAVLIRAVEPVAGITVMERRRRTLRNSNPRRGKGRRLAIEDLCSGPGKVCQAFGIAGRENGTDLTKDRIWLASGRPGPTAFNIGVSTRIGISLGKEHRRRFFIKGSEFVSRGKPSR